MSSNDTNPVHELHPEECWEFLRTREFGRLGYHLADEVHIVPINYAVKDDRLFFLTAEGSKLLGVTMNADVAFEVDEVVGETARSVIIRGRARRLDEHEEHRADQVPLHTWVDSPKYYVVEVAPEEVSGRAFQLSRPWRSILPTD